MTNREKLTDLIHKALNAEADESFAIGKSRDEERKFARTARQARHALFEFLDKVILDPVLETYEQAARRTGVGTPWGWKNPTEGEWKVWFQRKGITLQIIDASKVAPSP